MSETVTSQFFIKFVRREDICVKELENGITMFIQRQKHIYPEDIWRDIKQVSSGDTVTMTIESQNFLKSVWEITNIEEIN